MNFCRYSQIFGQPGQGVHSIRLFNIALVDLGLTLLAAYILSILTRYSFCQWLIGLIFLSIFLHYLFCVKTTVTVLLGLA